MIFLHSRFFFEVGRYTIYMILITGLKKKYFDESVMLGVPSM